MHKKYQELPAQFIPKHSHKYQLRKTLINTKFQWLMKYIHHEQHEADPKLSRAINIKQKTAVPFAEKKKIKEQNIQAKENWQPDEQAATTISHIRRIEKKSRPSLTTSKSIPDDQIFMDKHKLRNRTVFSRNITRNKKAASFFEKEEERGERSGSMSKMQRYKRVKTEGSLSRSKTRMQAHAKFEREPFVLSPWMFTEENIENNQQFKF